MLLIHIGIVRMFLKLLMDVRCFSFSLSGRTEAQSVQYGKEQGVKDRVFAR